MPVDNGIGHGDCTQNKQVGLRATLDLHIAIVERVLLKNPYYPQKYVYIDLYAGSGSNQVENCDGSPVVFLKAICGKMGYEAHFIEKDAINALELRIATGNFNSHTIYTGDNEEVLPEILKNINSKSYGLIYADPNGLPNFNLLAKVSERCPKFDILIRYPASAAKRNGKSLDEYIKMIKKGYWIIQAPEGKWQWSFLFGTNYDQYPDWKKHEFYQLSSSIGQEIFKKLNYTKAELEAMNQVNFLEPSPKELVIARSGGTCESCHEKPYTEIHHLSYKYPVEVPENMIAICHSCHCIIHNKEN